MIFRRNREETAPEVEAAEELPAAAPPQAPVAAGEGVPAATGEAGISVLSSEVIMEGNLVSGGELVVDGTIHGAVQAARITIDTNGAISGQVVAQEVVVRGRVIGPICGVRVHLVPGAQVEGDVLSQSIVVEDGAFIDGQIRHSDDPLGEWQQMWYGEEATEEEVTPEATAESYTPAADAADYVHPLRQTEEPAEETVEKPATETAARIPFTFAPAPEPSAEDETDEDEKKEEKE